MPSSSSFRFAALIRLCLILLLPAATLSGCVVAAVGGAAVGGYTILASDLPPKQQLRDIALKSELAQSWGEFNRDLPHLIDATVFDNEVLITGHVPDEGWHGEAVKRAWRIAGVKQVYDEIRVGPDTHFADDARDTWITTRLRGELVGDPYIKSINFSIKTADGVIYLMGIARSPEELTRATDHGRAIPDVRKVVSLAHVMKPIPPARGPRPAATDDELSLPPPPAGAPSPPPPGASPPAVERPDAPPGAIKSEQLQ